MAKNWIEGDLLTTENLSPVNNNNTTMEKKDEILLKVLDVLEDLIAANYREMGVDWCTMQINAVQKIKKEIYPPEIDRLQSQQTKP